MKFTFERKEIAILVAFFVCTFTVRILLFSLSGYKNDLTTFAAWFNAAAEHGPRFFYNVIWSDYPPFNVYLFWMFGSIGRQFMLSGSSLVFLIKLVPNLFDFASTIMIFAFVRKQFNFKISVLTAALYAFNPAVVFNISIWGQYDAIYTFFLIAAIMLFFDRKPKLMAIAFVMAVLTKPQSIALLPLFVFLILRNYGWRRLITSTLTAIAAAFVVILPFEWGDPLSFLWNIYFGAYGGYPYTTVNAFNLWAFGGMWINDGPILFAIGWIMFGISTAFALMTLHKHIDRSEQLFIIYAAFILFFSFFMLPTRIHERYLFPALGMIALMLPYSKKAKSVYGVLTFTCLANQAYVLHFLNNDQYIQFGDPVVFAVTLINLIVFVYSLVFLPKTLQNKDPTISNSKNCKMEA